MAAIDQLTSGTNQTEPEFPNPRRLVLVYDAKCDTLTLARSDAGPALSIDVDDGVWIRYVPESNQVIGIEIEDYSRTFLRAHPALARQWRSARTRRLLGAPPRGSRVQFKTSLLEYAWKAFAAHPRQMTMPVTQTEDSPHAVHRDPGSRR